MAPDLKTIQNCLKKIVWSEFKHCMRLEREGRGVCQLHNNEWRGNEKKRTREWWDGAK